MMEHRNVYSSKSRNFVQRKELEGLSVFSQQLGQFDRLKKKKRGMRLLEVMKRKIFCGGGWSNDSRVRTILKLRG